jgi:hypothetical protein
MVYRICAIAVAGLLAIAPTCVQAQKRVPVYVSSSSAENDNVGRQLVSDIKEAIRASDAFRLVEDRKQSPYLKYVVTTQAVSTAVTTAGWLVAYDNLAIPMGGAYIYSGVTTCRRDQVSSCARTALANLDVALQELERAAPELWKTFLR